MPIKLPAPIQLRCYSMINLGRLMNIFTIDLFMHVIDVRSRLDENNLMIHDLQDFQRLGQEILKSNEINDLLREDIMELIAILDIFITVSYSPIRSCGMWSGE